MLKHADLAPFALLLALLLGSVYLLFPVRGWNQGYESNKAIQPDYMQPVQLEKDREVPFSRLPREPEEDGDEPRQDQPPSHEDTGAGRLDARRSPASTFQGRMMPDQWYTDQEQNKRNNDPFRNMWRHGEVVPVDD